MPLAYKITYLPDGRSETFGTSRGNCYELGGGERLEVHDGPVWCRRCADLTHGEEIESLQAIDRRLAELNDPRSDIYRWMTTCTTTAKQGHGEDFRLRQVEKLRRRRRWREARVSPPRCLWCGTTDILLLTLDERIPHPNGTGEILVTIDGLCSTASTDWRFTPEGERLWAMTQAGLRAAGVASVWLGTFHDARELDGYLFDAFGFESDYRFRIDRRHPPKCRVIADGDPPEDVAHLLRRFPDSARFAQPAAAAAAAQFGWRRATAAVVFYDLKYDQPADQGSEGSCATLKFIGAFPCGHSR